ncbi:hypothetical protein AAJ76_99000655 [Vairimorpha ceranae]|uniref:Uncharacterized protein n=1 Tax=Vairimorpha ceranae TaxID=40302 RepID=A0A0F9W944_9MICR|nr:hypothetical protein AAJ76_99000655 [Vairimorpha ceranae]KKO74211.1 hypothetical protein AAJ76_99000655 [Vairimorpha ceranae]
MSNLVFGFFCLKGPVKILRLPPPKNTFKNCKYYIFFYFVTINYCVILFF